MINVLACDSAHGSTKTATLQHFTILPAYTESCDNQADARAFRSVAKNACEEAVSEIRKTHDHLDNFELIATVVQYQFLP